MWFCYEKCISGWSPVVHHMNKPSPGESKGLSGSSTTRSQIWEVPEDCLGGDGELMFGKLQKKFPPPQPVPFDEPPIIIERKEN